MRTFVFSEDLSLLAELIGRGKQYGEVCAVVIGSEELANASAACGADVLWIRQEAQRLMDDYVPAVTALVREEMPGLFLVGATVCGRAVAARTAAALDTVAITAVKELSVADGSVAVSQVIYGGGAVRTLKPHGKTAVILARHGFGEAEASPAPGTVSAVTAAPPEETASLLAVKEKPLTNSGVLTAKTVVGAGGGFDSSEHIGLARELAEALGGEMGYTRPLIEGDPPIVPNEPYIGVSGIQIKPDLYLAVGISGQTQHIVGVNESKIVACINKDPNAPVFRHSDYGIVGDMNELLPALTRAVKNARQ